MCGIIGAIGAHDSRMHDRLVRARDLMSHRGPDDAGVWQSGPAILGFRRLAVLDLSELGHQPMVHADGNIALVFNGEIYNFLQLRKELEQTFEFISRTDTEVILKGYLNWGWDGLLERLDGVFSFAIWDDRVRTLRAARDRAGKKPLFYAPVPQGLLFASTLNALMELRDGSNDIDPAAVDAFLVYQSIPAPMTIYEGAFQLPPAHSLMFDYESGRISTQRYWDVEYSPKKKATEDELLDELDDIVRDAVRKRLLSDVPLGAFLSGGVDSSLVVAMMAQEMGRPVDAVVVGFEEGEVDERPFAREVARKWGVNLHEHTVSGDFISYLPEIVWQYGQPIADVSIVPTYFVAKSAKQHVTVVLNGDGGDELFGGYSRPVIARAATIYRRLFPKQMRSMIQTVLSDKETGWLRRPALLSQAGALEGWEAFAYNRSFRRFREIAYTDGFRKDLGTTTPDTSYAKAWESTKGIDDVDRVCYLDFCTYLPDQLLTKMDVSTMAHGVEARSPLLDRRLIEFAARLPTAIRVKRFTTKYLLKRLAARYVPSRVVYRRKRGFIMPTARWLRGRLLPDVRASLLDRSFTEKNWIRQEFVKTIIEEHAAGLRNWSEQIWTLLILQIWSRQFVDGTLSRQEVTKALA